jgi:hypothetical protein
MIDTYLSDLILPFVQQYGILSVSFSGLLIGFVIGVATGWTIAYFRNRPKEEELKSGWDSILKDEM